MVIFNGAPHITKYISPYILLIKWFIETDSHQYSDTLHQYCCISVTDLEGCAQNLDLLWIESSITQAWYMMYVGCCRYVLSPLWYIASFWYHTWMVDRSCCRYRYRLGSSCTKFCYCAQIIKWAKLDLRQIHGIHEDQNSHVTSTADLMADCSV